jgi:hypothetical protein
MSETFLNEQMLPLRDRERQFASHSPGVNGDAQNQTGHVHSRVVSHAVVTVGCRWVEPGIRNHMEPDVQ